MTKKALIEVSLVDESVERTNRQIADEIFEELTENVQAIPWAARIEKTIVKNR